MSIRGWVACGTVFLLPCLAHAATDVADCAVIADDAARLACYDRMASGTAADEAPAVPVREPAAVPSTVVEEAAESGDSEGPAAPPPTPTDEDGLGTEPSANASAQASAPPTAGTVRQEVLDRAPPSAVGPPAERTEKRGFLRRLLSRTGGDKAKNEPLVAGTIVRITKLALGNYQITLDDGQVWRENEREMHTSYALGDEITIFEGAFGSHNMTNQRTGQSIKARRVR